MGSAPREIEQDDWGPPTTDELELSIFGPGLGECIVVHTGAGEWTVIDSCIDRATREPVALEYLKKLQVDPSVAIRAIVATHWHDDHIRGLAKILRSAPNAQFFCSAALNKREFLTLVEQSGRFMSASPENTSGLDEFRAVLDIIHERSPEGARVESVGPIWVSEGRIIIRRLAHESRLPTFEILSVSPSPGTMSLALNELLQFLPGAKQPKRRLVAQGPNELSVVLWIRYGSAEVLLGADLPAGTNPLTGWRAILASPFVSNRRAEIIKVPHHGSAGADEPEVWNRLLIRNPLAVVTPFKIKMLPKDSDLARLKVRAPRLYCTGSSAGTVPPPRLRVVDREAGAVAKNRRVAIGPVGHVRIRVSAQSDEWRVKYRDGAYLA